MCKVDGGKLDLMDTHIGVEIGKINWLYIPSLWSVSARISVTEILFAEWNNGVQLIFSIPSTEAFLFLYCITQREKEDPGCCANSSTRAMIVVSSSILYPPRHRLFTSI